ncbi:hypothetical protein [Thiococcus pfennigii]|uniref:hypothetical protein n=1 Tax=Thiococcus pfennigii TaxID=1057 RepID=UPI001906AA0B|nr:hypothetical protein [Thiococcus pfennigii]MBK1731395.1 hypothetical protein [Thiococcus pfennigii]
MQTGYLLIETRRDRPGQVRLDTARLPPPHPAPLGPTGGGPRLHYVARFTDIEAAPMHAHEALRRHLLDGDARVYRTDPLTAVAAVETIALPHQRLYLDPALDADPCLAEAIARRQARQRRRERLWQGVGVGALVLLALLAIGL